MAKITRISAGGNKKSSEKTVSVNQKDKIVSKTTQKTELDTKNVKKDKKAIKLELKAQKRAKRQAKRAARHEKLQKFANKKPVKIITFPFRIIITPFAKFAKYCKASWVELRQVQWPNRKTTWKIVGIVLLYTAIFMVFITILDALIGAGFNQLLKK